MKSKRQLARERLRRQKERAKEREREKRAVASRAQTEIDIVIAEKPSRAMSANGKGSGTAEMNQQRQRAIDSLERDVFELSQLSDPTHEQSEEISRLRREVDELKREFYTHLDAWQRVQLARHPQRPYTEDFIRILFENFSEIHGDRHFADDAAILTGMAWFQGKPVMVIGSQKGRDMKQRVARNFGQSKPEGYRKALRAMELAAKFNRPVIVFVDTQGAYPGIDAEERGQAEAIALNIREMARLPVPVIVAITGEGGSGGALAIAVGDRILMLENSIYSVISPEGCASILWRDASKAELAAESLKLTAPSLLEMKLIDEIVSEPEGGAHLDYDRSARLLEPVLARSLDELSRLTPAQLVNQRYEKFRRMGQFFTSPY